MSKKQKQIAKAKAIVTMTGEVIMPVTDCWFCDGVNSLAATHTSSIDGASFQHQKCSKCNLKLETRVIAN